MSDMSDLHDYENRPKKKNPFGSRPIPKSRIEWAIRSTLSIRAAAKLLGVSYNTFKIKNWKLQERLVRDGYLKQECSNCGYDDYREMDMRSPLLIDFLDGEPTNHTLDNLRLLCYCCFFIMKPTGRMLTTPKNVTLLRKKLEEVWIEKDND